MLSSIHPLGERSRTQPWGITIAFYIAGSVLGGALSGALFGLIGTAVRDVVDAPVAVGLLAVIAALGALIDLGKLPLPVRGSRQVNEDWLTDYRGWVYGLGFGFQLGTGVMTIIPSAAVLLTWITAALTGTVAAGAFIGATFGLFRAAVLIAAAGIDSPERLVSFHRRLDAAGRHWRGITVGVLVLSALTWSVTAVTA